MDRSVEKLARVYKGNVSLLLDVVRQCIVFQSIADMLEALRIIEADVDVDVVRIKNRMCKRYGHQTTLIPVTKLNSLLIKNRMCKSYFPSQSADPVPARSLLTHFMALLQLLALSVWGVQRCAVECADQVPARTCPWSSSAHLRIAGMVTKLDSSLSPN